MAQRRIFPFYFRCSSGILTSMNSLSIILGIILLVLIYIAVELGVIARELTRRDSPPFKDKEAHEAPTSGQTINVNLSQVPGGSSLATSVDKVIRLDTGTIEDAAAGRKASPPEPEYVSPKAASTGPHAVKCPKCEAENSSYRSECFNCGHSL